MSSLFRVDMLLIAGTKSKAIAETESMHRQVSDITQSHIFTALFAHSYAITHSHHSEHILPVSHTLTNRQAHILSVSHTLTLTPTHSTLYTVYQFHTLLQTFFLFHTLFCTLPLTTLFAHSTCFTHSPHSSHILPVSHTLTLTPTHRTPHTFYRFQYICGDWCLIVRMTDT